MTRNVLFVVSGVMKMLWCFKISKQSVKYATRLKSYAEKTSEPRNDSLI